MDADRLQKFLDMLPREGWRLEGKCIRSKRIALSNGLIGACPILAAGMTALPQQFTYVSNSNFVQVGTVLGLTLEESNLIAAAADCCAGLDTAVRAKLLEHCGLEEKI